MRLSPPSCLYFLKSIKNVVAQNYVAYLCTMNFLEFVKGLSDIFSLNVCFDYCDCNKCSNIILSINLIYGGKHALMNNITILTNKLQTK